MLTQEQVLNRWPRLIAHIICESLGYFTPKAAANAVIAYKEGNPFYCEWYTDIAVKVLRNKTIPYSDEKFREVLKEVNKDVIRGSFQRRHYHKGYMADYKYAKHLVDEVRQGKPGPVFASWF